MTMVRIAPNRLRSFAGHVTGTVLVGAALAAANVSAQTTLDGRYPVTPAQRQTADQVAQAGVPLSALAPNAPDRYTVKSGDTLWDISSVFLTTPWRWPELWGMNKQQVSNPHLIYPGQMLLLVKGEGTARLELASPQALPGAAGDTVRLAPRIRDASLREGEGPIASIPSNLIEPFLSQPLAVDAGELDKYPRIVATQEGRVYLGRGDIAYARGIGEERAENFHVFRPARPLYDPDDVERRNPIAYEAFYLGTARIAKRGEVATLTVQDSKQEMGVGDRLVPITRQGLINYVPHRPDRAIDGRIVSVYAGVNQAGQHSIVAINRGARDGLEVGHVLALLQTGETVQDRTVPGKEFIKLPDERIGEMFVFRVFDNISYALIMRVVKPVKVGDRFIQPDDLMLASADARPAASAVPHAAPVASPATASPGQSVVAPEEQKERRWYNPLTWF
jgi:nucleoid-associated protein YgaU